MDSIKYIGLDVHQSTIPVAVLNADGKLVMQSVIATRAITLLDFLHRLRGSLHVTFEGRRYAFRLAVRSAGAARGQAGGLLRVSLRLCCAHANDPMAKTSAANTQVGWARQPAGRNK